MAAVGSLFALLFVATILGTVGLWYAIDRETENVPQMGRADAERVARQDTDAAGEADGRQSDTGGNEWGSNGEWGVDDDQ